MPPSQDNQKKHDPKELEGVKNRGSKAAAFPWMRVSFFILVCGAIYIAQGPLPGKIWRKIQGSSKEKTTRKLLPKPLPQTSPGKPSQPAPQPTPVDKPEIMAPADHTARSGGDVRKMSKGFLFKTKVTLEKGGSASSERANKESYAAHYELKIKLPKATTTLEGLEENNAMLGKALPGLTEMFSSAKVSPFYYQLYENKTERLKAKSTQLSKLMTRHNFYDCETILNLKHPRSGRRVLLLQAEMDVVSDGSDGDRLPAMPDKIVNSSYYQPMTSYGWKKTGTRPNPLIEGWESRIKKAKAEMALAGTKPDRKRWLSKRITKIKREIQDMEARSYLIAQYDPFIVMPVNILKASRDPFSARVGDYAVVVYGDKIYPAIVGDAGPSSKVGEASLRLCQQINARSNTYSRPVSDLSVTYIVFPRTADPFKAPDYARWHARCSSLLAEIGGVGPGSTLHTWKNTLPIIEPEESASAPESP